jgi:dipeptidyl aminopeptidase/acylaminoacyl peptidase
MKKLLLVFAFFVFGSFSFGQNYTIQQYLNIKSASGPTFSPDAKHLAYLTNVTGTTQVWVIDLPDGKPRQLTNYDDNVSFVRWLGDGSGLIFGKAKGGDENTQFYWMKSDGTGVKALTDEPGIRHNFGLVSDDSKIIAYTSNKRDRTYFDIYSMEIATGKETLLYQFDGNNSIAAMNDSGTKFIINRDGTELSLDNNLYLVDARTKSEILLTPHTGAAEFGEANFVADGIVFTHNDNREFISLAQMRKKNASGDDWSDANRETQIIDDSKWDVDDLAMDQYGSEIAYTLNREGFSELYLRKYETDGKPLITVVDKKAEQVKLPAQGIVGGLTFNKDQSKLAFSFSSATQNGDIWVYDLKSKSLSQVTHSDRAGIDRASLVAPRLIKFKSFDGRDIPAWYYLPRMTPGAKDRVGNKYKTIVSVHGGPEGQERPGFSGLYQYYLSRGYAILATNVRGSTGYGKTYTHLDDVTKREDSVKDLAYAVEWLKTSGEADPKKISIMGGSYGGYMTLAAITLYPDLWAAAVDTVGIGNWESFLKNTSGYRRRQREVEYGRLDRDIDFLRSISPIAKIDRIKCPLFVIAGKNDPRVPWTEGQQMVDALQKRGATVQWKVYDDEGHGVSKLKNRLELYPLVADFLDKYMK